MKKVCIFRSNPVDPDSRVEKEAYSLKKNGYDVQVVGWDRADNYKEAHSFISVLDETIPITRFGYKAEYGAGFKSLIPYLKFQFSLRRWLKKHKEIDVIHACDFDTSFFTINLAKRMKKKYIYDNFDFLYCDPKNLFERIIRKVELSIVGKADGVIICTEERIEQIKEGNPKKVSVIHNTPMKELECLGKINRHSEKIKVVYVGILQDYRLLLEVANYFSHHQEYELHIGGFGKYEKFFENMCLKNDNMFYYGKMRYTDVIQLEGVCDIMLAIYDPKIDNHIYAAPNKFYESLMLGKPVIMVEGTGMSRFVKENDIGAIIDYSEEGFEKGLNYLVKRKNEWGNMAKRMKKLYQNRFCWEIMENRLVKFYNEIYEEY